MKEMDSLADLVSAAIVAGRVEVLRPQLMDGFRLSTPTNSNGRDVSDLTAPIDGFSVCKWNAESILFDDIGNRLFFELTCLWGKGTSAPFFHYVQLGLSCRVQLESGKIREIVITPRWSEGNTAWLGAWAIPQVAPCESIPEGLKDESPVRTVLRYAFAVDHVREKAGLLCIPGGSIPAIAEQQLLHLLKMRIDGNTAEVLMRRMIPNRTGSAAIGLHNYYMDWFMERQTYSLQKKDGTWKISDLMVQSLREPTPANKGWLIQ